MHCSLRTEPPEPATSAALKPFSAAGRPASNVGHFGPPTVLGSWQACLFSSPVPGLPLLFLWASESNVKHFGPPSNPSQRLWPTPASQPGEGASGTCSPCTAALELSLRNLPPRQPSNPSRQLAGQPATLGILDRTQTVLGSWQACLFSSPVPGLPLLFLWASESNVRHFGPASNPSQRLWPTPASQPCLRQAGAWGGGLWNVQPVHCSLRNPSRQLAGQPATLGILDRPQTVLGSWQACLFSSPVPGLPLLFLWASESNVRHFGPPSNPSQRLWPTPASQPCLRQEPGEGASGTCSPCAAALELSLRNLPPRRPSNPSRQLAGQPATLGILDRPRQPSNPSRQLAGQPATLGILDRPQTVLGSWQACLFSSPVPGLPLLFLWASESNVRHFGPASNPSQRLWPTPASQPCLRQAGAWGGSLWNVQPVHCSLRTEPPEPATSAALKPFSAAGRPASNVRHFGPPPNRSRQLAGLRLLFACSRPASSVLMGVRKPGEGASGTCSPRTAALELSLRNLPPRQPSNPSRQLAGQPATLGILDRPQTVLGSWQACLFSSPVPSLPLLFLWASESNVRHFGPPSNPSQRLWPTPASQPCLRQAGAWGGSLWNVQPVHCSLRTEPPEPATSAAGRPASNVRHFGPPSAALKPFSAAGRPASNVRHFGPPPNRSRQLAGQPATLGILDRPKPFLAAGRPASSLRLFQACLFCSYGLPKATLGILARLQTLPSAFGLLLQRSLACVRREPGEGASGTCSPCTAALELSLWNLPPRQPSNPSRQLAGLPLLFLWASESDVRHILDRPRTLLGSWQACLFSSDGLPKATLGIVDRPQTLLGSWQASQQR